MALIFFALTSLVGAGAAFVGPWPTFGISAVFMMPIGSTVAAAAAAILLMVLRRQTPVRPRINKIRRVDPSEMIVAP